MQKAGHELAKAEYAYKAALRKEVLLDRANSVPVGVINVTVYGEDTVNMLRLKRDIAQVDYDLAKELVMMLKADLKLLDNQIEREWHSDT